MSRLTAFEQGYAAFLAGKEYCPYDKEDSPHSWKNWMTGWQAAKLAAQA